MTAREIRVQLYWRLSFVLSEIGLWFAERAGRLGAHALELREPIIREKRRALR